MDMFRDRKEARMVRETVDAILAPLLPFLEDDRAEFVRRGMEELHRVSVADIASSGDLGTEGNDKDE